MPLAPALNHRTRPARQMPHGARAKLAIGLAIGLWTGGGRGGASARGG